MKRLRRWQGFEPAPYRYAIAPPLRHIGMFFRDVNFCCESMSKEQIGMKIIYPGVVGDRRGEAAIL